jgi:hypothetical protein
MNLTTGDVYSHTFQDLACSNALKTERDLSVRKTFSVESLNFQNLCHFRPFPATLDTPTAVSDG